MKYLVSSSRHRIALLMALLSLSCLMGAATQADARDHGDRNGFRDHGGRYHRYGYHHHHRGYWDQRNGVNLWINV